MSSPSLILFRGFPSKPAHVWSPFTTKLEARLRFAGLAYKTDQGAPPKGPRGKIPYLHIVRENNGEPESLSDTQLISEKLVADGLADDPNGKLTPAEKAHDLAIRALLEEKLYFYQVCRICIPKHLPGSPFLNALHLHHQKKHAMFINLYHEPIFHAPPYVC